jgi:hypothetical protein
MSALAWENPEETPGTFDDLLFLSRLGCTRILSWDWIWFWRLLLLMVMVVMRTPTVVMLDRIGAWVRSGLFSRVLGPTG